MGSESGNPRAWILGNRKEGARASDATYSVWSRTSQTRSTGWRDQACRAQLIKYGNLGPKTKMSGGPSTDH